MDHLANRTSFRSFARLYGLSEELRILLGHTMDHTLEANPRPRLELTQYAQIRRNHHLE